jgi:glyoxylase-like metal-dependent hydrolase (beta-lactamase superfamily II)
VLPLVKLDTQSVVGLVDEDTQEIIGGVTCYIGGRHTYASQYVGVNTPAGTVVLASDNIYPKETWRSMYPSRRHSTPLRMRAQNRMKQLATSPGLIIPGHNPAVITNFPNPAPGVS